VIALSLFWAVNVDMQGMHKGWIYCREHEDECVDFVTPEGEGEGEGKGRGGKGMGKGREGDADAHASTHKAHQRYQMREVMHGSLSGVTDRAPPLTEYSRY
jgi:hypothetical protein